MTISQMEEAIKIFKEYGNCNIGIAYEVIWVGGENAEPDKMNQADVAELQRLGWHWDNREEYWKHFV